MKVLNFGDVEFLGVLVVSFPFTSLCFLFCPTSTSSSSLLLKFLCIACGLYDHSGNMA